MRLDSDTFSEIEASLSRNRSRTLLTGFGVFWGIFMLLFLIGGGQGLRNLINKNFSGFATNTMICASGETTKPWKGMKKGRGWNLTYKDVDRLRAMVPDLDVVTPVVSKWGQTIEYGTNSTSGSLKGAYADYTKIETPEMHFGRFINEVDVVQERKVCVLGKTIYTSLFPDGSDPCGKFIKAGSIYFQVIGVDFSSGNMSINGRNDESVTVPLPVAQKVYHIGNVIHVLCMTGKEGVKMSTLEEPVREIIARQHTFDPTDKQALFLMNTEEMFSLMDNLFKGLEFLILLVGIGTILAGAIGVTNIMMVTVKERTVEIGIRRAIGATPRDIMTQIMLESAVLTLTSGVLGILFSVGVLSVVEKISGDPSFQIGFWTAVAAVLLTVVLSIAAGFAPSRRAMSIRPVEAMRDE